MNTDNNLWFIILDQTAGKGLTIRRWPDIELELQEQGFSYTVKFAESRAQIARLTDDGLLNGYRKILGIGDDATHREICAGILQNTSVASSEVLYGLLPVGTSNAWAKHLNVTHDVRERLERLKREQVLKVCL